LKKHRLNKKAAFFFSLWVLLALFLPMPALGEESAHAAKQYNCQNSIQEYAAHNSDVQGWVYVEGTNISYPVVFYSGGTGYYASRGYDKQYSYHGVIWADAQTQGGALDRMTQNTVLYGHNWTNCSAAPRVGNANDVMFAQLPSFHYLYFAQAHQFINYSTTEENLIFQIFAVFYTEQEFAYNLSSPTSEQMEQILAGARERSLHSYDVQVSAGDKIITLSTCTRAFGPSSRQRLVVMGKLASAGAEPAQVTANPSYRRPSL